MYLILQLRLVAARASWCCFDNVLAFDQQLGYPDQAALATSRYLTN